MGRWKLPFPHGYRTLAGRRGGGGERPLGYERGRIEQSLFDPENDVGETTDVADRHRPVVPRIEALAARIREGLGDSRLKRRGNGICSAGKRSALQRAAGGMAG